MNHASYAFVSLKQNSSQLFLRCLKSPVPRCPSCSYPPPGPGFSHTTAGASGCGASRVAPERRCRLDRGHALGQDLRTSIRGGGSAVPRLGGGWRWGVQRSEEHVMGVQRSEWFEGVELVEDVPGRCRSAPAVGWFSNR